MAAGIDTRHARSCRSRGGGGRCNCTPTYQAQSSTAAQAQAHPQDVPEQGRGPKRGVRTRSWPLRNGKLAPTPKRARCARPPTRGSTTPSRHRPDRSGDRYKPGTIRALRAGARLRVLPDARRRAVLRRSRRGDLQGARRPARREGPRAGHRSGHDPAAAARSTARGPARRARREPDDGRASCPRPAAAASGSRRPRGRGAARRAARRDDGRCGRQRCTPGCAAARSWRCAWTDVDLEGRARSTSRARGTSARAHESDRRAATAAACRCIARCGSMLAADRLRQPRAAATVLRHDRRRPFRVDRLQRARRRRLEGGGARPDHAARVRGTRSRR